MNNKAIKKRRRKINSKQPTKEREQQTELEDTFFRDLGCTCLSKLVQGGAGRLS
jgi:hypothetical protein